MPKAIFHFANGIGNFVMMMPALQALRDMTGESVDMFMSQSWEDGRKVIIEQICDAWDVVGDKVVNVKKDYDYWFYSPHSSDMNAIALFKRKIRGTPVTVPVWKQARVHESEHYMEIVRGFGYRGPTPGVEFPMAKSPVLLKNGLVIGICNGAFGTEAWKKKQWLYFSFLVNELRNYFDATVVGVGGVGELDDVKGITNYAGELNILESARVISQLDLLITTDTGCMHLADMMKIPILALFGSTYVSKNGPLTKGAMVLRGRLECVPCQYSDNFRTCLDYKCMSKISIGDVMAAARKIVKRNRCGNEA